MKIAEAPDRLGRQPMGFFVRPMRMEDIAQVAEVERECFPTGWIPTPFRRELRNRMAAYLVACEAKDPNLAHAEAGEPALRDAAAGPRSLPRRLASSVQGLFRGSPAPPQDFTQRIVGFIGIWFMVDEAHITAVGVRQAYRRLGVGELLLLGGVELAVQRRSRVVTLEVRLSNVAAQSMYEKYGFNKAGVRKRYYTDNSEDALIMTTDAIYRPDYLASLERLRQEHARRWGPSVRVLS